MNPPAPAHYLDVAINVSVTGYRIADFSGTEVDLNRVQWQVIEHGIIHLPYTSGELSGLH
jgi:hypothetical protein